MYGTLPYAKVSVSTVARPNPMAIHWSGRSRSLRKMTPSAVETSGLMKYPSEASTAWPLSTAKV